MTIALIVINLFLSFICLYFIIENYSLNKMLENSMEANQKYRQKLIKIQNIIRNNNVFPCGAPWVDCEYFKVWNKKGAIRNLRLLKKEGNNDKTNR